eukprot:m.1668081 g.1668081  ORF g.1668081 m.1668081 type:complete len:54 (-) comp151158_c0_seq1:78-239(-)
MNTCDDFYPSSVNVYHRRFLRHRQVNNAGTSVTSIPAQTIAYAPCNARTHNLL